MSHDNLSREFAVPHNRFRFCPFWFLNHDLEGPELRWQLQEMNRQGVGGAVMHPRHGLLTPWMSPEWLDLIGECVDECQRQGMKAYLYDENNWPSGPGDAQVFVGHPEYRMSHVELTEQFEVSGGRRVEREVEYADELIGVVAVPYENGQPVDFPASAVLLSAYLEGNRLSWRAPAGTWRLFVFGRRWHVGTFFGSYVDVLNPEAIRRFLEIAYQPYGERFSEHFGATIDGIFTDEPSSGAPAVWTPRLPGEFEQRCGYPLVPTLPALFQDMGPLTAKIRCDYFRTVTDLWVNSYMKQLYDWCASRGLNLMGHLLSDGELVSQVMCNGDFFKTMEYMSWAGLDLLTLATWPQETGTGQNNLAVCKFATSAADILDKPVIFSEGFGLAAQWAVDLRDLKWLTDFHCVNGVNLLAPHAFYYSIQGFRKFECPPGEFYQSPFWPYYRALSDYAGRLCAILREGQHLADLALFYPNRSVWAEATPEGRSPWNTLEPIAETEKLEINFNLATSVLLKLGYDYDIVSEDMLQEADFTGGQLSVTEGRMTFKALVMPACTTVSRATAEALLKFVHQGGRIIALGYLPTKSCEKGEDEYICEIFREIFGEDYDLSLQVHDSQQPVISARDLECWSGGVLIGAPSGTVSEQIAEPLLQAFRSAFEPDLTVENEEGPVFEVVHYHYVRDERHFLFLVNTSREQEHSFTVKLPLAGEVEVWDVETGEIGPCLVARGNNSGLEIPLTLPPVGSILLAILPDKQWPRTPLIAADLPIERVEQKQAVGLTAHPGRYTVTVGSLTEEPRVIAASVRKVPAVVELEQEWQFETLKPNILPLTDWQMRMENEVTGRDSDRNALRFTTTFQADLVPDEARLLLDGIAGEKVWQRSTQVDYQVLLNGQELEFAPGQYLDHYMYEADLAGLIQKGTNRLEIITEGSLHEPAALRHPACVIGRFAVAGGPRRPRLVAEPGTISGPWEEAGYPYYSGIGSYRHEFTLTGAQSRARLFLEMDAPGDLVEVLVNGKSCGVRAWEPWRVEITSAAQVGKNELELRIANSLQNLLVQEPKPSGLLGPVHIVPYREVEFDLSRRDDL